LQSKQFVAGAFFQNPVSGKMFFGGDNGLNHFYPDSIKLSTFVPNIVFESFKILNNEIEVKKEYNGNVFLTRAISNILRDVQTDAERGRIYLPQEELARHGVSETAILRFEYSPPVPCLGGSRGCPGT
jgi:hypothetical protein